METIRAGSTELLTGCCTGSKLGGSSTYFGDRKVSLRFFANSNLSCFPTVVVSLTNRSAADVAQMFLANDKLFYLLRVRPQSRLILFSAIACHPFIILITRMAIAFMVLSKYHKAKNHASYTFDVDFWTQCIL